MELAEVQKYIVHCGEIATIHVSFKLGSWKNRQILLIIAVQNFGLILLIASLKLIVTSGAYEPLKAVKEHEIWDRFIVLISRESIALQLVQSCLETVNDLQKQQHLIDLLKF